MVAQASYDAHEFGTLSDSSPYTTSSDDLFADINWPEDEFESPLSGNEYLNAENINQYENESPEVRLPKQTHFLDLVPLTRIREKAV